MVQDFIIAESIRQGPHSEPGASCSAGANLVLLASGKVPDIVVGTILQGSCEF